MTTAPEATRFSGRTAWARSVETPLREFLRTETGGAAFLLAAALVALVWVNVDASSYNSLWSTALSIRVGGAGVALDLRGWVNSGLMTFFFFVVGLEARREFDLGELRERRRVALPFLAGIGGMAVAVAFYLAINAGRPSAHGWGIAMSTDTAFALGMLALVGPRFSDRLRAFMLTVVVVDDIVALVVIATVYSGSVRMTPLFVALAIYGVILVLHRARLRPGPICLALAVAAWVALLKARRRAGRDRARDGRAALRVPGVTDDARARDGTVSRVPRAADRGARAVGECRAESCDLGQRALAAAVPSLDELRDRAAVRARERGHRDQRQLPRRAD